MGGVATQRTLGLTGGECRVGWRPAWRWAECRASPRGHERSAQPRPTTGASGDLAKKKTYPALFFLWCNG